MATTTVTEGGRVDRRIMVRVPISVGTFMDLICKYSGTAKGTMVKRVWAAGMAEVFGLTPAQVMECALTIPRDHHVHPSTDLKELARLLCGEE